MNYTYSGASVSVTPQVEVGDTIQLTGVRTVADVDPYTGTAHYINPQGKGQYARAGDYKVIKKGPLKVGDAVTDYNIGRATAGTILRSVYGTVAAKLDSPSVAGRHWAVSGRSARVYDDGIPGHELIHPVVIYVPAA